MNDDDDDEDVFVLCDDTVQKCDFESHVFCGVILLTKKKKDAKKMRFFLILRRLLIAILQLLSNSLLST